jgi:hypothetical protein
MRRSGPAAGGALVFAGKRRLYLQGNRFAEQ